jgi:hypothetical protein
MPRKLIWTDVQDTQIKRLRSQGSTWDTIAEAMGVTRWTVIERGRRIGARLPPPDFVPDPEDPQRAPLPPGDPRTWNVIVQGSCLEGIAYPNRKETR